MQKILENMLDWMNEQGMVIAVYEEGKKEPIGLSDKNSTIVENYLGKEVKVDSAKLQDIEANLKLLKSGKKLDELAVRLSSLFNWFFNKDAFIEYLEFEKYQEIEKLEFQRYLKEKHSK